MSSYIEGAECIPLSARMSNIFRVHIVSGLHFQHRSNGSGHTRRSFVSPKTLKRVSHDRQQGDRETKRDAVAFTSVSLQLELSGGNAKKTD